MKILVTGGTGFIGGALAEGLRTTADVLAPSSAELDLLDGPRVHAYLERYRFDVVVHAATWDATRTSRKDSKLVLENTLRMFHNVARARGSFGRLVHLGSGAEYDRGRDLLHVREEEFDVVVPLDQYGFAKYLIRKHCEAEPGFVNLSLFGVFGGREDWRLRFLSNACCHALLDLPIQLSRDSLFDYISVDDVVSAVRWCVSNAPAKRSYNVCSGMPVSLLDLAALVREVSRKELDIIVHNEGRGPAYVGDPSAFVAESGWRPCALTAGVRDLYAWFEQRGDSIDRGELLERAWLSPRTGED